MDVNGKKTDFKRIANTLQTDKTRKSEYMILFMNRCKHCNTRLGVRLTFQRATYISASDLWNFTCARREWYWFCVNLWFRVRLTKWRTTCVIAYRLGFSVGLQVWQDGRDPAWLLSWKTMKNGISRFVWQLHTGPQKNQIHRTKKSEFIPVKSKRVAMKLQQFNWFDHGRKKQQTKATARNRSHS